jgi:hypothetical protein
MQIQPNRKRMGSHYDSQHRTAVRAIEINHRWRL